MAIDGETAQAIIFDVMSGREPSASKVTYTKEATAFRATVEDEWTAYSAEHPDAVLYVPSDLPPADMKVPKIVPPKKGTKMTEAELAEGKGDSHFYGAWKGGGKGSGGGPAGTDAVKDPGGEPGTPERAKAVDKSLSTVPSSDSGPQGAHLEVRKTDGSIVTGRLESKQPGEISIRQFKDGKGYVSVPVKTADVSHVVQSDKHWVQHEGKWVRVGTPAAKAFEKAANDDFFANAPAGLKGRLADAAKTRAKLARAPKLPKSGGFSDPSFVIKGTATQKRLGGPGFEGGRGGTSTRESAAEEEAEVDISIYEATILLDKAPIPAKVILVDGGDTLVVPEWTGAFTPPAPAPAMGNYNSARWDSRDAARILQDLLSLKGSEANEADDAAKLDTAIGAVLDFIRDEAQEITGACADCGHADDCSCTVCPCETHTQMAEAGRRNSKADEARLSKIRDLLGELGLELALDPADPGDGPDTSVSEARIEVEAVAGANITFRESMLGADMVTLAEAAVRFDDETKTVWITPIKPGWGNKRDNRFYTTAALEEATKAGRFDHLKSFADHPTKSGEKELPERSVKDWVATTREASWDAARQRPIVPLVVHDPAVYQRFKEAPEQVAFSVLGSGVAKPGAVDGRKGVIVESIAKLRSVDWVTEAGAGGALDFAESAASEEFEMDIQNMTVEQMSALKESNPALYRHLVGLASALPDAEKAEKDAAKAAAADAKAVDKDVDKGATTEPVKESEAPAWAAGLIATVTSLAEREAAREKAEAIKESKGETAKVVTAALATSTLPKAAKDAIVAQFAEAAVGSTHASDEALKGAVEGTVKLAESMFGIKAKATTLVEGMGAAAAEPTSLREAAVKLAESSIEKRFGKAATPHKDRLVFTAAELAGSESHPVQRDATPDEFPVSEGAADVAASIAAKF